MTAVLRVLAPGDEARVEAFLGPRVDSSLFLLGNLRTSGLVDTGAPCSATWIGAFDGGSLAGIAAHCWNGVLLLQAPRALAPLARAAIAATGRPLAGLSGPRDQVLAARTALGVDDAPASLDHEADLYGLDLDGLQVPAALATGSVTCSLPRPDELPLLVKWRDAYSLETLGATPGDRLRAASEEEVRRLAAGGNAFVLRERGVPVAFSAFNARLPEVVQVGGVYTPPGLRGRGFARAVVAGSLLTARSERVGRGVLFTERANDPARRAYLSLGFRVLGDYGLVLFAAPVSNPPPSS